MPRARGRRRWSVARDLFPIVLLLNASLTFAQDTRENETEPAVRQTTADPVALAGLQLLEAQMPYSAGLELARAISRAPGGVGPEVILVAAEAYSRAKAWKSAASLLEQRPWLDEIQGGMGRVLLARAYLEDGRTGAALAQYERAFAVGGEPSRDAAARVGFARTLERLEHHIDAAEQYLAAAEVDTSLAAWFQLSAIQAYARAAEPDSVRAVAEVLDLHGRVSTDSLWLEVARAFFEAGVPDSGLVYSDSLSHRGRARFASRFIAPALLERGDTVSAIETLEAALETSRADSDAGSLLLELAPTAEHRRLVAASDLRLSRPSRAADQLEILLAEAEPEQVPGLTLQVAEARFSAGAYRSVIARLRPWLDSPTGGDPDAVASDPVTQYRMWFLYGRALYRNGRRTEAFAVWGTVAEQAGAPGGAWASFLLADIQHDAGNIEAAREAYERTVTRFPRSQYAGHALVRLGSLDMLADDYESAAERFDEYRRRYPGGNWFIASTYWAAKASAAAGDSTSSSRLYREVLEADALSFYGIQAGAATGVEAWDIIAIAEVDAPELLDEDAALVVRMDRLRELGWRMRAKRELSAGRRAVRRTTAGSLALATELNAHGWTWEGVEIGWSLYEGSGRWTDRLLEVVYPLIYREAMEAAAERQHLDPALVAAVVRRESVFDRAVVSGARAVGLMQLLPSTGTEVARRERISGFHRGQLEVAEVNLRLGTRYLREQLDRFGGSLTAALIAYNAGPHRYIRWREFPEFNGSDPELAIDRIPFSETRRYVKAINAHAYVYRHLYGLGVEPVEPDRVAR